MEKECSFGGKIVILGFGSIGTGVLPLILRHIDIPKEKIMVVTRSRRNAHIAEAFGVNCIAKKITRENYFEVLDSILEDGDFLLNLSVEIESISLMALCAKKNVLYLDACIEPWAGGYTDASIPKADRTNYALRKKALDLRDELRRDGGSTKHPTAVLAHGANPGLVSHFTKRALLDIARETGRDEMVLRSKEDWALLAESLGVRIIHIAERDTQVPIVPKKEGEFVNTWSANGFIGEGLQPSELGFGTHEKELPPNGHRQEGNQAPFVYLDQPGINTMVRSWVPLVGQQYAFLITHDESISITDYLSVKDADGNTRYCPTVHYAYHPTDSTVLSALELQGRSGVPQEAERVLTEQEIEGGVDELGVLLIGDFGTDNTTDKKRNAYWYGSRLSLEEARALVPYNGATTLQVTAGILGAMIYAIKNPSLGIISAEDIPHEDVLGIADHYLGKVFGVFTDWTSLSLRVTGDAAIYSRDIDLNDHFQFKNFIID